MSQDRLTHVGTSQTKLSNQRPKTPRLSSAATRRIEEGARRGRETTSAAFDAVITRKRYCALVGIHPTSLKRWLAAGVVRPRKDVVQGVETWVFSNADVELGKQIARLLRDNQGKMSVAQAAQLARGR